MVKERAHTHSHRHTPIHTHTCERSFVCVCFYFNEILTFSFVYMIVFCLFVCLLVGWFYGQSKLFTLFNTGQQFLHTFFSVSRNIFSNFSHLVCTHLNWM